VGGRRAYSLYTKIFKRKGDKLKPKEKLINAIDILKECGADEWVKIYEKEMATLQLKISPKYLHLVHSEIVLRLTLSAC
jgi:hypothetical protein